MFRPVSSSKLQQFIGWINGQPAEYVDTKRPAMPSGRWTIPVLPPALRLFAQRSTRPQGTRCRMYRAFSRDHGALSVAPRRRCGVPRLRLRLGCDASREVTRVESTGVVTIKMNMVTRNMKQFGYTLGSGSNVTAQRF
jgi:hypothetical protein